MFGPAFVTRRRNGQMCLYLVEKTWSNVNWLIAIMITKNIVVAFYSDNYGTHNKLDVNSAEILKLTSKRNNA